MKTKKGIISTAVLTFAISSAAKADTIETTQVKKSVVSVDRKSQSEAELQRRKDLLAHAEQLKYQYSSTIEMVKDLNDKLETAKGKCQKVCTSQETEALFHTLARTSEALIVVTFVAGGMANSMRISKLAIFPAISSGLFEAINAYLHNKDKIYLEDIISLQNQIDIYLSEAKAINDNINIVTNALTQTIKILQEDSTSSSTTVGQ